MSKLHFYESGAKVADGDGKINKTEKFTVKITKGEVRREHTYVVKQGQSFNGDLCRCKVGASKNGTATFEYVGQADEEVE